MYKILAERKVEKQLRRLPKDVFEDVVSAIQALAENPRPRGARKLRGVSDGWRIVVRKDYRVLYTVNDRTKEVRIFKVVRRSKETYKF